jgi:2-amino-4-hydroxy-6-hydroxymethyldihydropteridine diphosphokinase
VRAGIALGSNLGDSLALMRRALAEIRKIANPAEPVNVAPLYRSSPLDCPLGSPDFLNTVIEIDFSGTASELLKHTQRIENQLGRERHDIRNAPRSIDLDILYLGDTAIHHDDLILPHPRMTLRRFVMQPLADIAPDLILMNQQITVSQLLKEMHQDDQSLVRCDKDL